MTAELESKKAELLARKAELLHRIDAIRKDYGRGISRDFEEQAIELENAEVLAEISRLANEELAEVEAALVQVERKLATVPPQAG